LEGQVIDLLNSIEIIEVFKDWLIKTIKIDVEKDMSDKKDIFESLQYKRKELEKNLDRLTDLLIE